ncbi:DUF1534 domain-containing protein [Pseudomonas syringae]|uniref:DUF1534 domain-containing protein n=1 Tax=Pseudomonas syringae TaxID=317 RepID=A0A9Q4A8L8_PSESX|nr:DUF1534 domain-containing protein [Pseudomonas syringae]MCF5471260.1 DUF1534 domain-containing protein [Pseudomonas syringae]MCF5482445.1 DUF1534 domain-containing protein [Pseudomonas syringae]MCF5486327.1 DUF1534 domain-containing protein [Pseudomonas syringae]MCF5497316.1 DUF1534 domain-containing protein [Pseudomonas syringae]
MLQNNDTAVTTARPAKLTGSRADAPRWHAFRDALRHESTPHHTFKVGRRASRNAFPRGAWERE